MLVVTKLNIYNKKQKYFLNVKDSIRTCYSEVNVALAEAEGVWSGFRMRTPGTPCMGAVAPEN